MRVHGHPWSARLRAVRMLCLELSLDCAIETLPAGEGAYVPEALDPLCRAPVLEDDGWTLTQAPAILCHLAAGRPDWCPRDGRAAAEMQQWLCWDAAILAPLAGAYVQARVFGPQVEVPSLRKVEADLMRVLYEVDMLLIERQFTLGWNPSITDLAIFANVAYLSAGGWSLEGFPALSAWYTAMSGRPAARASRYEFRPHTEGCGL